MITPDVLKTCLPVTLHSNATQEFADKINMIANDPLIAENIRENFISYTSVLRDGRYKTEDYLNAVGYVSYKMMGYTNQECYIRVFPQRYAILVAKNISSKDLSAYVSAYNRNKLVNLILEQTLIPTFVLNQDIHQKAIMTQYEIMTDTDVSDKVRCEAANSLLVHLKQPEIKKIELDIGISESSGMRELKDMMGQLAEQQLDMISKGVTTKSIAHQKLVKGVTINAS